MGALRRTLLASVGCAVAFTVMPPATAAPATPAPADGLARAAVGHQAKRPGPYRPDVSIVTLVTGDRVRLTTQPDGTRSAVPIPGAHRSAVPFSIRQHGSSVEVVPEDAARLVRAGRVDARLFEVAGLVAAGYDDRKVSEIPLEVRHAPGRLVLPKGVHARSRPTTLAATTTAAISTPKKDAGAFWRWLTTSSGKDVQKVMLSGHAAKVPATRQAPPRVADEEMYDLTVRLTDRNGRLVTKLGDAFLTPPVVGNRETEQTFELHPVAGGLGARVPRGTYFFGEILVTSHGIAKPKSYTHLALPEFALTRNTIVALDARKAKLVKATVSAASPRTVSTTFGTIELFAGKPWTTLVSLTGPARNPLYALPTKAVADRPYLFALSQTVATANETYDLVVGTRGRVPANPAYVVRDADLATMQSRFAVGGVGLGLGGMWFREALLPGEVGVGLGGHYDVALPSTRVHRFSVRFDGVPLPWSEALDVTKGLELAYYTEFWPPRGYAANQRTNRTWNSAAYRPEGHGDRFSDGRMTMWFAPAAPSQAGGSVTVWDRAGIDGRAELRREGELVARSDDPFELAADVQSTPKTAYGLDLWSTRKVPWSRYATSVHARWAFSCQAPPEAFDAVGMLNVRATGPFDAYGRAPAGKEFQLDLPVDFQPCNGVVRAVKLAVSYDDGGAWQSVPVSRRADGRWVATVAHPNRPGTFVSLRLTAQDDQGNTVEVTSIRSYSLRPTAS